METATGRRFSVSTKDSSDHSGGLTVQGPSLSQAHRRMSRVSDTSQVNLMRVGGPMDRRMSTFRRMSLAGSQRTDMSHLSGLRPLKLQNTYKTEPGEGEKFNAEKVEKVMTTVLTNFLEGEQYEAAKCSALSQSLSDVIKNRVKDMNFPRYKIVCNVAIGQHNNQSMQCSSRCLWSTATDSSASATYKNATMYAVATVFALYFE